MCRPLPDYRAQADELGWSRPQTSPVREALQTAEVNGDEALARLLREHGATLPV